MICLASYNQSSLDKMQQDALSRVNEMHRRSKQMVQNLNGGRQPSPAFESERSPSEKKEENFRHGEDTHTKNQQQSSAQDPLQGLFSSLLGADGSSGGLTNLWDFKIDEEKALIGLIIYILAKNKADPKLLIGLGYLLL